MSVYSAQLPRGVEFSEIVRDMLRGGPVPTSTPEWLLVEEGFTLAREHEIESLFAIANGYVGNRGSLAEGSPLSAPATFVAGIFEHFEQPESVPQLMTLPDWTGVRVWMDEQPLSLVQGEVLAHRRILDMRKGLFWREWRHRDPHGRITRIVAFRLASMADRHLLLQSVVLAAENYSAELRLESSIELPAGLSSSAPADWKTRRSSERPNVLPLALRVPGGNLVVTFGVTSQLQCSPTAPGEREIEMEDRRVAERFRTNAMIGTQCCLHRLISVYTSRDVQEPFDAAVTHANRVLTTGFAHSVAAHEAQWGSLWKAADVEIEGDIWLQQAVRFAGYHLISASNPQDERVSIGARALTGEAYKGHVFWDTEIYMVPFYIFTHPPSARALLMYRYHLLDAAREKARSSGFRGAMYPWESADTGEETTPRMVIAPSGEVIRVLNGDMEIHITADIAYAVWQYWQATGDDDFFRQAGAEIILESARFWASRGNFEADGQYHIRHVIGPDEYHENVDDNAYTNLLAAWNLRRGAETVRILQQKWPDDWRALASRLELTREEIGNWARIADAMFTGFDPKTLLFEQFSGYFRKEPIDLESYEPRSAAMDTILGHKRIQQTNVVKQSDVVMAMFLLWDEFPPEVRAANFRYYEPRTGHGSSLSPSMHALVASRLGERDLAEHYLRQAAEIDLGNNMGNAAGGIHAAAIGGLWQAMILGFAGMQAQPDGLCFAPQLLPRWRRLSFPLQWRSRELQVSISHDSIQVAVEGPGTLELQLTRGSRITAQPGHEYAAHPTSDGWKPWRALD